MSDLQKGDYVLATKWHDGDSRDQWCCGFFEGMTEHDNPRYDVIDSEGRLFRNNGFRRCEKIHPAIGKYLVEKSQHISAIKLLLWEYVASEAHDILVENWDYENKPQEEPTDRFAMGTPSVDHAGENKEDK